jgi:hypothetical protein
MNKYGAMAQLHWRTWLPTRYATIPDPDSFFSELGIEVSDRIAALEIDLLGPDDPNEEFFTRVGRRNMARLQAEEMTLPELVLLTPETDAVDEESDELPPEWWIPTAEQTAAAVIAEEEALS